MTMARLHGQLIARRWYVLRAAAYGAAFLVCLPFAPAASQNAGRMLQAGTSITDSLRRSDPRLSDAGPFRVFRIHADTGHVYDLSLKSDDFEPRLMIEIPVAGISELLDEDYDTPPEAEAHVRFRPPRPGDYLVVVTRHIPHRYDDADTLPAGRSRTTDAPPDSVVGGSFTLALHDLIDRPAVPRAINVGDTVSSHLGDQSGILRPSNHLYALYTFHALAGQDLSIVILRNSLMSVAVGRLDQNRFVEVVDSSRNSSLRSAYRREDPASRRNVRFTVPRDGDYAIQVAGGRSLSEDYALALTNWMPSRVSAKRLTSNVQVTDSIESGAGDDAFREWMYVAKPGARLTITMRSSEFDTYLSVGNMRAGRYDELQSNDDARGMDTDSQISMVASDSEPIFIHASATGSPRSGTYTLVIVDRPPIQHQLRRRALPALGSVISDSLRDEDQQLDDGSRYVEWVHHVARAGDRFVVTVRSKDFDPFISVGTMRAGQFVEFSNNDDAPEDSSTEHVSRLEIVAAAAGDFIIRVNTFGPNQLGEYRLEVDPKR